MDALKFDRHASHFSLPQALSYLLSLPTTTSQSSQSRTPLPLALLTDFTHRIEHHSTEAMIQRWANGLRAWLSNRPGAGIQKTIAANGNANASARKGEAGGPRWWDGVWDEDRSETELKLELEEQNSPIAGEGKGEAALSNGSNGSATLNGVHGSGSSAEPHVPEIHMAWDGMVVRFSREVE